MSENKNFQEKAILRDEFIKIAKEAISKYPELQHSWNMNADGVSCSLTFPKQNENGFEILIEVSPNQITVFTVGAHQHFDSPEDSNETKIKTALALVRDLLSSDMRIRELRAGNSAYRWALESLHQNNWRRESSTGLLFWNYFGKRSEKIFQNYTLPTRLNKAN